MLILKPAGRGNWAAVTMTIEGKRLSPMLVRVGALLSLAGVTWRICEVRP